MYCSKFFTIASRSRDNCLATEWKMAGLLAEFKYVFRKETPDQFPVALMRLK